MRTFEEYIGEARQNYIFGGTDNRNSIANLKTFAELEKGDKFYWFFKRFALESGIAKCYTFLYTRSYDGEIMLHSNKNEYVCITKEQYDSPVFVDETHNVTYVASTDYDIFVDTVKEETGIVLKETDIQQI